MENKKLMPLCPICGNDNSINHLFVRDYRLNKVNHEISLIKCINCEHVWQDPMPEEINLLQYYDENFYESKGVKFSLRAQLINKIQFYGLTQSIREVFGGRPIKILDYGCGQGQLIAYLTWLGHDVEGCEISKSGREISKNRYGFNIHDASDDFFAKNTEKYDLIILSHVLEHLPNPIEYVEKLKKLISNEGYIAVDVPNINSWEAGIYKGIYIHLDIPRHVHHYSKKSLKILMGKFLLYSRSLNGLYAIQFPISGLRSLQNYIRYKNKYNSLINFILIIFLPLQITISILSNKFSNEKICIGGFFGKK